MFMAGLKFNDKTLPGGGGAANSNLHPDKGWKQSQSCGWAELRVGAWIWNLLRGVGGLGGMWQTAPLSRSHQWGGTLRI